MGEIRDLSRQIDLNNLTYYCKSKNSAPINFIGFKGPLYLYKDIFNGDTSIEKSRRRSKRI